MIGSVQMICGMGFIIGTLRLLFGPDREKALWMVLGCGGVWWLLAVLFGGGTPESPSAMGVVVIDEVLREGGSGNRVALFLARFRQP